ncbi:MAG: hypothetical protein EON95_00140 [Caulobacteraceae bacterium]|nr:MAG: hypothetical protein EON95_00140 [Caulobacteraceae bacterium]
MSMVAQALDTGPVEGLLSVQDLAHRIAREMRIAASIADDCQDALGEDARLVLDHETSMRLQGLDLLSQQLIEIGRVLDGFAALEIGGGISPALLDDIRLSDLKHRLSGTTPDDIAPTTDFW